jgi:CheY-like chemotaxis protein
VNPSPSASQAPPRRCVLYVEDHPVNVVWMEAVFRHRPQYELVVATDGASGIDAAQRIKPDLLLLDIGLPDCQGTELLHRIRQIGKCSEVPAVAVTADHSFDIAGSTFCDRWNKPVGLQDMLVNLDRLLSEPDAASRFTA